MVRRPNFLLGALSVALVAAGVGACAAHVADDGDGTSSGFKPPCGCEGCCSEPLCPTAAPDDGDTCNQIGLVCGFDGGDTCPSTFTCVEGSWRSGPPKEGSSCSVESKVCAYPAATSCGEVEAVCTDGGWRVSSGGDVDGGTCCDGGSCCAALSCPSSPPTAGAACAAEPLCNPQIACKYPAPCDATATLTATCPSGVWELDAPTDCGCVGATHAQCSARPACRWIGPACDGGDTVSHAMCEPIAGCASESDCPAGYGCESLAVDPCPGGQCGSCSIVVPECILGAP